MKFNCDYSFNPIDIEQPYFDTLKVLISKSDPDLISFKGTQFAEECVEQIENRGYEFIPINYKKSDTDLFIFPIVFKTSSFNYLASSYYTYKQDTLEKNKNLVSWFKFKNVGTGHIFYVFNLQLQENLNQYQSQLIAYDLLRRIDQISSGAPVIFIGEFYNKNCHVKKILTDNWKNVYPLSEIKTPDSNSDFLVNDFLKVKSAFSDYSNDSLVNNVVFKFNFNTQKINKNKSGDIIPE